MQVDGLVEAFEATDRRWVLGVQWHPERASEVSDGARRIFDAFVEEARARRTRHPPPEMGATTAKDAASETIRR